MPFAFARSVLAGGTPEPVYTLSASPTSANEGQSVTITLTTENVDVGTSVPYSITGINSADLSSGSISGNFVIEAGGADSLNFTFANDAASEGTETMVLTAAEQSVSVSVADTSRAITYDWYTTPSATPDEGDVLNFVARVYNSSETMWWHQNLSLTDVNPIQGQLTKAGPFTSGSDFYYTHTGSTTIQEDVTTEGNETMYLYLRSGSQSGTTRDTFTMVIQDTSVPLTSDRIGSGVGNAATTNIISADLTMGARAELSSATFPSGYDWGDDVTTADISYNGMWALVIGSRLSSGGNGGVAVYKRNPTGSGASMSWDFVEIIVNATNSTVRDASISDDGKWVFMTRSDLTDVVAVHYSSSPGSTSYSLSTTLSGLSQGGGNAAYCRWVDIDKNADRMFMGLEYKYRSGTTNGYGGVLCWRRSGSSWSVEKFFQHAAAQSVNYQWGFVYQPPSIAKKDGDVITFIDRNSNNYSTTGFGWGSDAPHDASGNHYIHVFRRSGNTWYESTYNMGNGNHTHNHVSVSGNGGNFITYNPKGSNPVLYTFDKSNGGITLTNSNLPVGSSGTRDSIVLNEDASVALVHYTQGTYQYRSNFYDRSGNSYVTRSGWTNAIEPNYTQYQVINQTNISVPSVKMTGSGNTVIIQSDFSTGNAKGAKILNVY